MADRRADVFGRDAELTAISEFLGEVSEGPIALLLTGDAGMGKTTLWRWCLTAARDRSYRVLGCQPVESETKLSFAALGDLLGGVADELDLDLPPPQARALDVALLRAEPEDAPSDSRAVSLAVLGALRFLTRDGPVIVAVDDAQWLDPPSARVLEFAFRRLESERLGVMATLRSGRESPFPLGLDRSLSEDRLRRIAVGPLPALALGGLLEDRLGLVLTTSRVGRLHSMSGGNPFFALEVARAMVRGDAPAAGEALPVPHNLRELVRKRVVALSDRDRDALLIVAAASSPTVAEMESIHGAETGEGLARAAEAGLIEVDGDHVRFSHPLFGSAILSEASPERLRELHRRLADVPDTTSEERARHLALGTEVPDPDVAAELDQAARLAAGRGAPDAAAELCEMAARLTPADRGDDGLARTLEAAKHHVTAGDAARAQSLLETAVEESPPGPRRAKALLFLGLIRPSDDSWAKALELFQQAIDEAGPDDALRGAIEQGLGYACLFSGDTPTAETHARTALELAERGESGGPVAEALEFVAYVDFALGKGFRRDLLDRAVELEVRSPDHWVWDETRPTYTLAQLLKYTDEFDAARPLFQGILTSVIERGRAHSQSWLHFHLAELECWAGRWDIAEEHARRGVEAALQTGETAHYRSFSLYAKALVAAQRGDANAARETATEGLVVAERFSLVTSQILNLSVLGFLELFEGNPTGARDRLGRASVLADAMGTKEPALLRFVPDEVETLVTLGDLGAAAARLEPFEERSRRLDRAWGLATGARCRGLLLAGAGDLSGALDSLGEALVHHERVPEPFSLARTLFSLGRIQRRAKLKAEARESFERSLEIYGRLGARRWAERAGTEARRIGVRSDGPLTLTATEERVATLVAEGRTNREAADELFMSVNTIEWNLTRIYRKLGVRSRTELAAKLRDGS
jgi:DNA-binding CsgD family transcriptional regulator